MFLKHFSLNNHKITQSTMYLSLQQSHLKIPVLSQRISLWLNMTMTIPSEPFSCFCLFKNAKHIHVPPGMELKFMTSIYAVIFIIITHLPDPEQPHNKLQQWQLKTLHDKQEFPLWS